MINLRGFTEEKHLLSHYLPWAAIVAPGVVLQKDCLFQKTVAFRGYDLDASSSAEIISSIAKLNHALRQLESGWAIFCEVQRYKIDRYPRAEWHWLAAEIIDEERRVAFESDSYYDSCYYFTFCYQIPSSKSNRLEGLFFSKDDTSITRELELFIEKVRDITNIMSSVFLAVGELDNDQTMAYLHSTISPERHTMRAPEIPMYIDAMLTDATINTNPVKIASQHVATITVKDFPSATLPGLLNSMSNLPLEFRWVTRWIPLSKQDSMRELDKYRKRHFSRRKNIVALMRDQNSQNPSLEDSTSINQATDSDEAIQEVGSDIVSYGYYTTVVCVHSESPKELSAMVSAVKQVIQSHGFVVREETINAFHAWLSSIPGHVYANVRRPLISSMNLVHMLPVHAVWGGNETNEHMLECTSYGEAHIICATSGRTPFRLNLNVGDVGHTFVVGPTGAGKSTLLGMLGVQFLRYPNSQVIIFDKDHSALSLTKALNGRYYEPGLDNCSFQPLSAIDSEQTWVSTFISDLLEINGMDVHSGDEEKINIALSRLLQTPRDNWTFSGLLAQMPADMAVILRNYIHAYGGIFHAHKEHIELDSWTLFEMGSLMELGEKAVIPALRYLLHRVDQRLDGRPTLLIMDEAWIFLGHAIFAKKLQEWLKTLRKKNVYVVFATQEIADVLNSSIMDTVINACHSKIFLPNQEAMSPEVANNYRRLGLSDTEIQLLSTARAKREYYYRSSQGRRLFDMCLGEAGLKIISDRTHIQSDVWGHDYLKLIFDNSSPWIRNMISKNIIREEV